MSPDNFGYVLTGANTCLVAFTFARGGTSPPRATWWSLLACRSKTGVALGQIRILGSVTEMSKYVTGSLQILPPGKA